jgi:hypothetical protein
LIDQLMKRLTNIFIVGIALLVGLIIVEVTSRFIMPISPGAQLLTLDGTPFVGLQVDAYRYKPNSVYRQVAAEFDARTTIDSLGNRIPSPIGSPEVVLIGDSFTFGHGLPDEKTFASIYCRSEGLNCANLGRPGLGTTRELDILEYYLTKHKWQPKIVKLFMVAMSGTLMSGNDLYDNYLRERRKADNDLPVSQAVNKPSSPEKERFNDDTKRDTLRRIKNIVLEYSNLGRFLYFNIGHHIRTIFSPPASEGVLEIALQVTREQIFRFRRLAKKFSFKPEIFVIHPVQDLIRNSAHETMQVLENAVPGQKFVSSADLFTASPSRYYFSYDGHWNETGARKFAEFLSAKIDD